MQTHALVLWPKFVTPISQSVRRRCKSYRKIFLGLYKFFRIGRAGGSETRPYEIDASARDWDSSSGGSGRLHCESFPLSWAHETVP
jgi:hypothetical protein